MKDRPNEESEEIGEGEVNLPLIDMLHYEPAIDSFSVTFVPRDEVSDEEKESLVIPARTTDGRQINSWLTKLFEALLALGLVAGAEDRIAMIAHGGGDRFTVKLSGGGRFELPAQPRSSAAELRAYNALQCLAMISEAAFRIELLSAGRA
jgi:hypothetical protein